MADPVITALTTSRALLGEHIAAIGPGDWGRPTPCGEWDVRSLVNHIVSHEYRFADNLASNDPAYYASSRDDDFLGDHPLEAWRRGVVLLDHAIQGLPSLDVMINWRVPVPARTMLVVRVFEAAVHGWDLATALDRSAVIDPLVADLTLPLLVTMLQDPSMAAFFAPSLDNLPADASSADRLLHLAGR